MSISSIQSGQDHHQLVIPVLPFGASLSAFFALSYAACVLFYLLFPELVLNHAVLTLFLPGFKLLDWKSFILGLIESVGYGWYVALIFGPLFNFFNGTRLFGR
jgi:hypothetical protein